MQTWLLHSDAIYAEQKSTGCFSLLHLLPCVLSERERESFPTSEMIAKWKENWCFTSFGFIRIYSAHNRGREKSYQHIAGNYIVALLDFECTSGLSIFNFRQRKCPCLAWIDPWTMARLYKQPTPTAGRSSVAPYCTCTASCPAMNLGQEGSILDLELASLWPGPAREQLHRNSNFLLSV